MKLYKLAPLSAICIATLIASGCSSDSQKANETLSAQTMTVSRTNKADGTYIVHSVVPHTSAKGKFVVSATSTESIRGKPQKFVVDKSGQVYTKKRGAKVYTPQAGTTVSGVFEATQTKNNCN